MRKQNRKPREVTGGVVLLWLVAFFGVVFVVNGIMVKAATSTFGGVETSSSYKAGQMFEQEVAKAERQDERRWQIGGRLTRDRAGEFKGAADAGPGQWELIIDLYKGDDRVFRSRSKVILQ